MSAEKVYYVHDYTIDEVTILEDQTLPNKYSKYYIVEYNNKPIIVSKEDIFTNKPIAIKALSVDILKKREKEVLDLCDKLLYPNIDNVSEEIANTPAYDLLSFYLSSNDFSNSLSKFLDKTILAELNDEYNYN